MGVHSLACADRAASRPPSESQLFVHRFGMEPETFLDMCFAALVPVINGARAMRMEFFEPLRNRYGAAIDRFIDESSRDPSALRAELQRLLAARLAAGGPHRPARSSTSFPGWPTIPSCAVQEAPSRCGSRSRSPVA